MKLTGKEVLVLNQFKEKVADKSKVIDPGSELYWKELCYGFCLAHFGHKRAWDLTLFVAYRLNDFKHGNATTAKSWKQAVAAAKKNPKIEVTFYEPGPETGTTPQTDQG